MHLSLMPSSRACSVAARQATATLAGSVGRCRHVGVRSMVSSTFANPPAPPAPAALGGDPDQYNKPPEIKRLVNKTYDEPVYKLGKHRSNALELIHQIPIVEVDGEMAICDGGGGALGHPLEYISLERPGAVEYCKYCSLRFTKKDNHH